MVWNTVGMIQKVDFSKSSDFSQQDTALFHSSAAKVNLKPTGTLGEF